jgi:hypothetical protein
MDTEDIIVMASAREATATNRCHHARNSRYVEFRKFCSGGMMVFTGLMLATVYCLLTHQIQN